MEARLLGAVLGVVLVQVEAAVQSLDLPKIAGFWREVGVASKQRLALVTPRRLEALFLTPSEAALTVKAAYSSSGSCETENIVGSEIDVSGRFVFPGHREIRVVDTDYERYAILRLSLEWQGKDFHVLKYFTRSLEDDYEPGFWKFRELTADTGLYLVARHGRCAKLLKEVSLRWAPLRPGLMGVPAPWALGLQGADLGGPVPGQDAGAPPPPRPLRRVGGAFAPASNKPYDYTRCPE
ncbi:epididymal-specific lipocalin-8 [Pteronotus mesoamericanus]|uniref:epididymal-specific lipocalin-8 n=1 Tax=Pteronotus mesoamericanus TaxID=1884717 RepID=UPI0023EC2B32|nr:epididymal-specific lipocalin-8 [Pteronotus parnellii mesoamericanus]